MIRVTIPGIPVGKGRPRITTRGGKPRAFTPERTVSYEGKVALAGQAAMDGRAPIDGPVKATVFATFAIPQSWPRKRKEAARYHTSKPDGDNIAKAVGDGLNGIVWRDDSQVAVWTVVKSYGEAPGVTVEIVEL